MLEIYTENGLGLGKDPERFLVVWVSRYKYMGHRQDEKPEPRRSEQEPKQR